MKKKTTKFLRKSFQKIYQEKSFYKRYFDYKSKSTKTNYYLFLFSDVVIHFLKASSRPGHVEGPSDIYLCVKKDKIISETV